MAFLTTSDISSLLPAGFDVAFVDRFLIKTEAELKGLELEFSPLSAKTRQFHARELPDSIFDLAPMSSIEWIKIKNFETDTEINLTEKEYILSEMFNFTNFNKIKLIKYHISTPHYLEIRARFGVYIDFSDPSSEAAKLLKAIIVDATIKQLNFASSNYQTIASAKSGDNSSVSFRDSSNRQYYSSIVEDPEFSKLLNYFS
jgi:hypothetical protein